MEGILKECLYQCAKYKKDAEEVQRLCDTQYKSGDCGYKGVSVQTLIHLFSTIANAASHEPIPRFSHCTLLLTITQLLHLYLEWASTKNCNPKYTFPSCPTVQGRDGMMFMLAITKLHGMMKAIVNVAAVPTFVYLMTYLDTILIILNKFIGVHTIDARALKSMCDQWVAMVMMFLEPVTNNEYLPMICLDVLLFQLGCTLVSIELKNLKKPPITHKLMAAMQHIGAQIEHIHQSKPCVPLHVQCDDYITSVAAMHTIKNSKSYKDIQKTLIMPAFYWVDNVDIVTMVWWPVVQRYIKDIKVCMEISERLISEERLREWQTETRQKCAVCTSQILGITEDQ